MTPYPVHGLGALASIYVELRRQNVLGSLNAPTQYIQNGVGGGGTMGPSYGPARIKAEFAEWAIANDQYGTFANDFPGNQTPEQFRQQVAYLILNEPAKLATSALRTAIDQWAAAHQLDPNIPDIADMPGILATLYNIGPNMRQPHPNPQLGGSDVGDGKNFGQLAKEFADSQFAKDFMKDCGCNSGKKWSPPPRKPAIRVPGPPPPPESLGWPNVPPWAWLY